MSQPKESNPFVEEIREQENEREGVRIILVYRNKELNDTDYVYVVEHKANLKKGIREGDIGIPCETPESNETPRETIKRLFAEEVGMQLKDLKVDLQSVQHLEVRCPQHRIKGDLFLLWITNLEVLKGINPKDTDEINRGFFLSLKQLLEDPNLQLRQDLNPRWFLEPLVKEGLLAN